MKLVLILLFLTTLCRGIHLKKGTTPKEVLIQKAFTSLDGYDAIQGYDSGGYDIGKFSGDTQALKKECDKRVECIGFNTGGWLKYALTYRWMWTPFSDITYAKKGWEKTPNFNGYDFTRGLDSGGGDIRQYSGSSIETLKNLCDATPTCVGFTSSGWLKNSLKPKNEWSRFPDESQGTYTKSNKTPPYLQGYTYTPSKDSPGYDIRQEPGKTAQELREICDSISNCAGFTTEGWLKYSLQDPSQWTDFANKNTGTYVKLPLDFPGYSYFRGKDSGGYDLRQLPNQSVQGLKNYCDSNLLCVAFTTTGWIKSALKPMSEWGNFPSQTDGTYFKPSAVPVSNFADYTFTANMDSEGGDIGQLTGKTSKELKDACDSNPTCVGFTTNGWLKHSIKPQTKWVKLSGYQYEGIYVRASGQLVPVLDGYNFKMYKNSLGGDIEQRTFDSPIGMKSYCDSTPGCVGFTTDGVFKKSIVPEGQLTQISTDRAVGVYVKKGAQSAEIFSGYTFYQGLNPPGLPLQGRDEDKTLSEMRDKCRDLQRQCAGFNTRGEWASLWSLKPLNEWIRFSNDPAEGFYAKPGVIPPPALSGYDYYERSYLGSSNEKQSGKSMEELKEYCDSKPTCKGFTTEGTIYSTMKPRNEWVYESGAYDLPSFGTYVKQGSLPPNS